MTASVSRAHATIPPARAAYHHVCERIAGLYEHRGQLARVVVCTTGALVVADFALVAAAGAVAVAAVPVALVDGCTAVASAGVATDAVVLPASNIVPPMPKNDATLRPARSTRDAPAG
jgi:hypothetical protein